jgi:hypothetical protein
MGIPGLLWIRQGTSHEIDKAVGFASDHLRNALGILWASWPPPVATM